MTDLTTTSVDLPTLGQYGLIVGAVLFGAAKVPWATVTTKVKSFFSSSKEEHDGVECLVEHYKCLVERLAKEGTPEATEALNALEKSVWPSIGKIIYRVPTVNTAGLQRVLGE